MAYAQEVLAIEVTTYLRSAAGEFVPAGEASVPPADKRHIEGFIRLTANHIDIIDQTMWDDVDQLWAYIADMISTLEKEGRASTYFPDQPIPLTFTRVGKGRISVSSQVGDRARSAVVDEDRFISGMKRSGLEFF